MGVEQEFVSFNPTDLNHPVKIRTHFKKITSFERIYFEKGSTSIRTKTGHAIYADGDELEVCTPPVCINKGFASRLTDLIVIGKEKVVHAIPELKHTGLSMHWNLSRNECNDEFYAGIALPFHLFGLTPLSGALNMRSKLSDTNSGGKRVEFLGDALTSEDQIKATALLLGAYTYAYDTTKTVPIVLDHQCFRIGVKSKAFIPDGRYNRVYASIPSINFKSELSAQHYLELFYQWLHPFAKRIGTTPEIDNLSSFVFGKKKLEFDHFKYYAYVRNSDGKINGTYYPLPCNDPSAPNKVVQLSGKEKELPLEGKLLGEIVLKKRAKIDYISWEQAKIYDENSDSFRIISGIDNIYEYASSLNPDLSQPRASYLVDTMPKKIEIQMTEQRGPKEYDSAKDLFEDKQSRIFGRAFVKEFSSRLLSSNGKLTIVGSLAAAYLLGSLGSTLYQYAKLNREVYQITHSYEQVAAHTNKIMQVTPQISTNTTTTTNVEELAKHAK